VSTTARLLGRQGARLVEDLGRDLDLADVVEECGELGLPARQRVDSEIVADGEHHAHHITAVCTGVLVVGLDHVSEQERSSAIRVGQFELAVQALLPLACEDPQQAEERKRQQEARFHRE
jgi:hypothetical protein